MLALKIIGGFLGFCAIWFLIVWKPTRMLALLLTGGALLLMGMDTHEMDGSHESTIFIGVVLLCAFTFLGGRSQGEAKGFREGRQFAEDEIKNWNRVFDQKKKP